MIKIMILTKIKKKKLIMYANYKFIIKLRRNLKMSMMSTTPREKNLSPVKLLSPNSLVLERQARSTSLFIHYACGGSSSILIRSIALYVQNCIAITL